MKDLQGTLGPWLALAPRQLACLAAQSKATYPRLIKLLTSSNNRITTQRL